MTSFLTKYDRQAGVMASGIRQVLYVLKARAEQLEKQGSAPTAG